MARPCHGGIWNASDFARSPGGSDQTARHDLDLSKRQVKSPKVYVTDSGRQATALSRLRPPAHASRDNPLALPNQGRPAPDPPRGTPLQAARQRNFLEIVRHTRLLLRLFRALPWQGDRYLGGRNGKD